MKTRRAERIRSYLGAQILFNNNNSTVECSIRNISSAGAKLLVSPTVSVPEEFDLTVPQKGRTYRCRLRWRLADSVGVEFMNAASAPNTLDAASRVRELEDENAALQREVKQLMLRVGELEQVLRSSGTEAA